MKKYETIIFDLGGVLVDWNPEYVFLKAFNGNQEKTTWFLNNVCTSDWNLQQDAGRTIKEAVAIKVAEFPEYESFINLFYEKWTEMFSGVIEESVTILNDLSSNKNYKIYALTNWSAEKWEIALKLFPFFKLFDGVIVSGVEKMVKPNPKIYQILLDRFNINPHTAIFIDDKLENVEAANKFGIYAIHFKNSSQLKTSLKNIIHF